MLWGGVAQLRCKVERPRRPRRPPAPWRAGQSPGDGTRRKDEVDALACRTTPCSGGGSGPWSVAANRSANGASASWGPSGLGRRSGWTGHSGRAHHPDASYRNFVHEVRRYRLGTVLRACAETGALLVQERHGRARLSAPNYVTPFAVAAVAGAALDVGTEHRTALADRVVVMRLCGVFSELDDPDLADGPDGSLRGLLSRLAYQQFGFGGSLHDEAARSSGLLLDHAARITSGPSPEEWERLLGVPLETCMWASSSSSSSDSRLTTAVGFTCRRSRRTPPRPARMRRRVS